ncbi:aldo/keto reductase family oxidoreductase [Paraburkholderia sp. J76]|uniref:aldo/keto reductase family oxidoreductase n=1 Tax=Paraburkholderia sp. J76 TaxID=2805439 RepID=UPI002ABDF81B|nr:aldo/keto reductase family oxidoreductase [Paraburkholderia sp. J76]
MPQTTGHTPGPADTFVFAGRTVGRMGYGAMQLSGPGVFGPPKDRAQAIAVLRLALELGVNHIDTSDFYGPHVTNQIIREALHPYPADLTIVTKVGAVRDDKGAWLAAQGPADIERAVHDNLRNLGIDAIDVVNLRIMGDVHKPAEGPVEPQMEMLASLRERGLVRHIGVSNATAKQIDDAEKITPIACVQNHYNLVHRDDDALIDALAARGIAYVPFFPLGGFTPIQSTALSQIAHSLHVTPMAVALAWLLHRSPNILLIPGTSSVVHLRENMAAATLTLSAEVLGQLDAIGKAQA